MSHHLLVRGFSCPLLCRSICWWPRWRRTVQAHTTEVWPLCFTWSLTSNFVLRYVLFSYGQAYQTSGYIYIYLSMYICISLSLSLYVVAGVSWCEAHYKLNCGTCCWHFDLQWFAVRNWLSDVEENVWAKQRDAHYLEGTANKGPTWHSIKHIFTAVFQSVCEKSVFEDHENMVMITAIFDQVCDVINMANMWQKYW